MARFKIDGADRKSGEDIIEIVTADDEEAARAKVESKMLISSIEETPSSYSALRATSALLKLFGCLGFMVSTVFSLVIIADRVDNSWPRNFEWGDLVYAVQGVFASLILVAVSDACMAIRDMARNSTRALNKR